MYTKSHNVEIMMDSETDEIIKWSFKSLLQKHREWICFNISLFFDDHLQKIGSKRGGSNVDSPK